MLGALSDRRNPAYINARQARDSGAFERVYQTARPIGLSPVTFL